jgi:hypothetical protein
MMNSTLPMSNWKHQTGHQQNTEVLPRTEGQQNYELIDCLRQRQESHQRQWSISFVKTVETWTWL